MNRVNGVVAYDENRCMGHSVLGLPWHISADLQAFKARTIDGVVIMGRKTWESLPNVPLPHRINLIVSKTTLDSLNSISFSKHKLGTAKHPRFDNVTTCANIRVAISYAQKLSGPPRKIFIIGGARIFQSALEDDLIDTLYVTRVHGVHNGDIFFPALPTNVGWHVERMSSDTIFDNLVFRRL